MNAHQSGYAFFSSTERSITREKRAKPYSSKEGKAPLFSTFFFCTFSSSLRQSSRSLFLKLFQTSKCPLITITFNSAGSYSNGAHCIFMSWRRLNIISKPPSSSGHGGPEGEEKKCGCWEKNER